MRQNIGAWLMGYRRFLVIEWRTQPPTIHRFTNYEAAHDCYQDAWGDTSDFLMYHYKYGWHIHQACRISAEGGDSIALANALQWD